NNSSKSKTNSKSNTSNTSSNSKSNSSNNSSNNQSSGLNPLHPHINPFFFHPPDSTTYHPPECRPKCRIHPNRLHHNLHRHAEPTHNSRHRPQHSAFPRHASAQPSPSHCASAPICHDGDHSSAVVAGAGLAGTRILPGVCV